MAGFDMNANALLGIGQGAVQSQNNLLPNIAQAAAVQNQLLGTKIRQAEYDAQLAQGNALLGATDAYGRTDYAKARATMARTPASALGAAQAMSDQNTIRHQDIANTEAGKNAIGSILSYVRTHPDKEHLFAGGRMAKSIYPGQNIDAIVDQIAQHPDGIKGGIDQLINSMQSAQGQQANAYGTPGATVDNGQQVIIGTQGSAMTGGQFQPSTTVQKQVGPDSNARMLPVTMKDPETGQMITVYRPAGELRQSNGGGNFTGRRINTAGGTSEPMSGAPAGYNEQYKTGQNVQNSLSAQQSDVTQNIATLRNLDALLSSPELKNVRSRTLKDIANNASKFGIDWGGSKGYATIAQEIDKAGATLRKQMMDGGSGPHTNAGPLDLGHITPSIDMTPTAARALTNEILTSAIYQQGRQKLAASLKDPTKVLSALADYDQHFDPRFATIQRLGPEEGREYAKTHIADQREYADAVRRMARAQREKGYDFGMTPQQIDRILGAQDGR